MRLWKGHGRKKRQEPNSGNQNRIFS